MANVRRGGAPVLRHVHHVSDAEKEALWQSVTTAVVQWVCVGRKGFDREIWLRLEGTDEGGREGHEEEGRKFTEGGGKKTSQGIDKQHNKQLRDYARWTRRMLDCETNNKVDETIHEQYLVEQWSYLIII